MTITAHFARIAGILKTLAAGAQILIVIAWFVMWKYLDMPFWTAGGYCLIAGVVVYTVVGAAASFLLTLARVQPITALFLHVPGFCSPRFGACCGCNLRCPCSNPPVFAPGCMHYPALSSR